MEFGSRFRAILSARECPRGSGLGAPLSSRVSPPPIGTVTYYAIAPGLVERISLRQDARQVWEATYLRFILPCALLATTGLNRAALAHYRRMINYLTRLAESSCIGTLEPRIPAQSSASYPEPRDGPGCPNPLPRD